LIRHVSGKIVEDQAAPSSSVNLVQLQAALTKYPAAIADYYQRLRSQGLAYGINFQSIQQLWQGQGQALGRIQLPDALQLEAKPYQVHPVLLDACFQLLGATFSDEQQGTYLPIGIEALQIYGRPGNSLWSRVQVHPVASSNGSKSQSHLKADVELFDTTGALIADVKGLSLQYVSHESLQQLFQAPKGQPLQQSAPLADGLYEITWQLKPKERESTVNRQPSTGSWLIFVDSQGLGVKLADLLRERGDRCILVFPGESYGVIESQHYALNPSHPQDFQQLCQDLVQEHDFPDQGIIHLWSLDEQPELEQTRSALQEAQIKGCRSVLHLVQALAPVASSPRLWLVTRGTQAIASTPMPIQVQHTTLWGLSRVIRLEHPELSCTCCDLDPSHPADDLLALLEELCCPEREEQIAYRLGDRYAARLVPTAQTQAQRLQRPDTEAFQLTSPHYGVLDNLTLVPVLRRPPNPGEVEIRVHAAGVNFRDILKALGLIQVYLEQMGLVDVAEANFGGECAGTIVAIGKGVKGFSVGDEVITAPALGSLSQFVTVNAQFVIAKPRSLTFAEAATIPTVFLTAYYGLHHLANIQARDRVLIHAAAGGVGHAAIQLAQQAGAEIFATASPGKWEFLKSMGVKHVMNSRTLDFADEVMTLTRGQGVDVVLNSLNGDYIPKSLDVLAPGGRFVEIGKIGIWDTQQVQQTRADIAYFPFDLLDVSQESPDLIASMLKKLVKAFWKGSLKPLPHTVFPIEEAAIAFRYVAQAKHIGKVVITLPSITAQTSIVRPDSRYLITGGFGALGLQVAQWLAAKGAKHLMLVGRNQASPVAQQIIQQLEQAGVQVACIQADVSNSEDLAQLLNRDRVSADLSGCRTKKRKTKQKKRKQNPEEKPSTLPLRGIIHAAGVLDDGILRKLTWERFSQVMASKVLGAWNLHELTQDLPLDFFVCFSSIASLLGSPGQGSYAAANAFMDGLIHHRRRLGLPGLSINWGPWAEAGMAASLDNRNQRRFALNGITLISPEQGLQALEALLAQNATQTGVMSVDWSIFLAQVGQKSAFLEAITPPAAPVLSQRPEFLQPLETDLSGDRDRANVSIPIDRFQEHIQSLVAQVLGFSSPELINSQESFADLGMDSLMAVELTNRLKMSLGCGISQTLLFDYPTVEALANYLIQEVVTCNTVDQPAPERSTNGAAHQPTVTLEVPLEAELLQLAERNGNHKRDASLELTPVAPPASMPEIPEGFYQFRLMPEYLSLQQDLERVEKLGNPFFIVHDDIARDITHINGQELINYSSYNYLGLSGDPTVSAATQAAIADYGTSVSASRVISGDRPIHRELEREIAEFLGTEDCIVYVGGHTTNVTTIGHLLGERDLILYDTLSHDSIRQGCALSGATAIAFPHNDWRSLEQLLQQHRPQYQKVLIAVEGIYSTDGDLALLPEVVAVKKRYKALLLVDEAHSIGVLGQQGRGIGEHFHVPATDVDLWMGTLSKSFASCGGYIAGCKEVVQYLKYTAPGFVYSVGMSPPNTASALAALRLLRAEPERVARLRDRSALFLELAQQQGLNTGASHESPIIPIIVGEPYKAVQLSHALFERRINVGPMVYPSVPYNAARLRFFLTCLHTEEQIRFTVKALVEEFSNNVADAFHPGLEKIQRQILEPDDHSLLEN
jgi:myxalamid-type polyketide synthase MxaB